MFDKIKTILEIALATIPQWFFVGKRPVGDSHRWVVEKSASLGNRDNPKESVVDMIENRPRAESQRFASAI